MFQSQHIKPLFLTLFKQRWMEAALPFLVMCLLFGAFAFEVPNYLSIINLQQLMRDFAEPAFVAMAIAIVIFAGGIDLSVGAIFAITNFAALYLFRMHELPLAIAILGVVSVGVIIGMVNGYLVAYVKTRPFLTTLAMLLILRACYDMTALAHTVELATAMHDTDGWYFLGAGNVLGIPTNMAALIIVGVGMSFFLKHLRPGSHIMAVGANRKTARHVGINVKRTLFLSYVLSGAITAIAGLFYAAKQNSAGSDTGLGWELTALTAVILGGVSLNGGRGSISRVFIGSAILFLLSSGLLRMNVPGSLTSALIGLMLIVAVAMNIKWVKFKDKIYLDPTLLSQTELVEQNLSEDVGIKTLGTETNTKPILQLTDINKVYGGINALEHIKFKIYPGEIHTLVGENGAGKSTLAKIIAGAVRPTSGSIILDGKKRHFRSPTDSLHTGIAMVYQESSLIPTMTIAQNLRLGNEPFVTNFRSINNTAKQTLQALNLNIDPQTLIEELGTAQRQLIEIARAINLQARVLIFDEPTASLTPAETRILFRLLNNLRIQGVSIIFITHALEEALQISDRISIMRNGKIIECKLAREYDRQGLIRLMIGCDIPKTTADISSSNEHRSGEKVLSVENICMKGIVNDMSFSLYAGEVVGIAGLVGSGRTEIAKIISGVIHNNRLDSGKIILRGNEIKYRNPAEAMRDGIVYVTEDRNVDGLFGSMTIDENIYLGLIASKQRRQLLYSKNEKQDIADEWVEKLSISTLDRDQKVIAFSGGNQQKVLLAKSLVQQPEIIFFDEPTHGIDVGIIPEIHKIIRTLADEGKAVVVISSYLPEILSLSDRILVTRRGQIVKEFHAKDATEEKIMNATAH